MIVSTAEEMNPTRRSTMEDCHVVHEQGSWNCHDEHISLIGVYDGHGGRDIVDFLEEALVPNIAQELRYNDPADKENDVVDIPTRLERAFLLTDIQSRMAGLMTSGATVAICLIKKQPKSNDVTIYAANVGDARAVLSSNGVERCSSTSSSSSKQKGALRLTYDHRADDPNEISRIESTGGFVLRNRVLGILAVARSLGDHGMKEYVIGRPHLSTTEAVSPSITGRDDDEMDCTNDSGNITNKEFIIVACDGLWDVMEDQEAVDMVRKFVGNAMKKGPSKEQQQTTIEKEAAQFLVDEALRRGSTDNITVVISWI